MTKEEKYLLPQYSYPALKKAIQNSDVALLHRLKQSNALSEAHISRLLKEEKLDLAQRLLLFSMITHDSVDAPSQKETPEVLSRLSAQAGAGYAPIRLALSQMKKKEDPQLSLLATDGQTLFYPADPAFRPSRQAYFHTLVHCLFLHMIPPFAIRKDLWNLACDISAEYLRQDIFDTENFHRHRDSRFQVFPEKFDLASAPAVYSYLLKEEEKHPHNLSSLLQLFTLDDHRYWYVFAEQTSSSCMGEGEGGGEGGGEGSSSPNADCFHPEEISSSRKKNLLYMWQENPLPRKKTFTSHRLGQSPGSRKEKILLREEGKYDFSRYLQRFCTLREEMVLDPDNFDYIPYHYGIQRYGNLPFLEPLEYSEIHRVAELVIAIDTSGSCTTEIVQRFLSEIQRILLQKDTFFRKRNIHLIQCDSMIQDHTAIHCLEDWMNYRREMTIIGRGGTDFTPVFRYVKQLQEDGALKHLKGLLYFTDGDGIYPKEPTPYETAFVFPDFSLLPHAIPSWIVPLSLTPISLNNLSSLR